MFAVVPVVQSTDYWMESGTGATKAPVVLVLLMDVMHSMVSIAAKA